MNRWTWLLFGCAACGGTSSNPGLFADLRVAPGTFVEGTMPEENGGPAVVAVDLATNRARVGQIDKPFRGALDANAGAAAIGLTGDTGYWIVPAGLPDVQAPAFPTFDVSLSFSLEMKPSTRDLVVRAVDETNHFGVASIHSLDIRDLHPPEGILVVSLSWDRQADVDLHVVDPEGIEIYKGNINSYTPPPPGQPMDPTAYQKGALLDFDSNAACVIDGRRRENVVWRNEPPNGHYIVRIDTFSLCGEPFANWSVDVWKSGARTVSASGQSGPADEMTAHDRGAGVLAVEFDWP